MVFIYRNRTKETLIETDHLNKPSTLLMQIVYLCRYTRASTCMPSQSFQCFLAPVLHIGTLQAQNPHCTSQDFLGPVQIWESLAMNLCSAASLGICLCFIKNSLSPRNIWGYLMYWYFPNHFPYCSFLRDSGNYLDCWVKETNTGNETGWK